MKLYERIENNNFDEIDRNRAIELIEGGNGHLVYNENYFKLQKENEELKIVKSAIQTLQINSMEDEKYIVISKSSFFDGSYKHLLDEFIPVQKVKDKIEELNNISNAEKLEDIMIGENYTITELVQYVLRELIEGEN